MTTRTVETSPQLYARIAGILYLIIIVGGIFAELFVRQQMVVNGDPAATATNILAHEMLYRLGFASGVIMLMCALPLLFILYHLLNRVNKSFAILAVFFNLSSIAIEGVNLLHHYEPLIFLKGVDYLSSFSPDQLQALAYTSLRLQSTGYDLSLAFFGFFCIFIGYLLFKSTFFPRLLGVLMVIAGLCYPINSFVNFLAPQYSLFPYIGIPPFVAELSLCLWLMVKGVDVPKWEERASAWRVSGAQLF